MYYGLQHKHGYYPKWWYTHGLQDQEMSGHIAFDFRKQWMEVGPHYQTSMTNSCDSLFPSMPYICDSLILAMPKILNLKFFPATVRQLGTKSIQTLASE